MITVYRRDVTTIKVHSRSRRGVSTPIFLVVPMRQRIIRH